MRRHLVMITGLSGSGKSSAARALEDEGFFVVDNLPLPLLPQLLTYSQEQHPVDKIAVVTDARHFSGLAQINQILADLRSGEVTFELLFIEACDDALVRRFSETRRRHPLAPHERLSDGIAKERELLDVMRQQATCLIDSSFLTPHQLRAEVLNRICPREGKAPLTVLLQSFGFRYGIPPGSDLVMDVRFLPNPHFESELQAKTGVDQEVSNFALQNETGGEFLHRFCELLSYLLPKYRVEGKSYLTVSIGCTGGRHRSVAVVESIARRLPEQEMTFEISHRDIAKR